MNQATTPLSTTAPLPPDDLRRTLVVARPDTDQTLPHIGLVGDTYTTLLSGQDTAGHYCMIDMHVPPGGGPPLHRHDFEETFIVLEGEVEVTFRDQKSVARAGETVHIPANAPHRFHNTSAQPARLLCISSPAGLDEFFAAVGVPVASRTAPPPALDDAARAVLAGKVESLTSHYRTEFIDSAPAAPTH